MKTLSDIITSFYKLVLSVKGRVQSLSLAANYKGDYPSGSRFYGELPRLLSGSDRYVLPLLNGALGRTLVYLKTGAQTALLKCTLESLSFFRHSKLGAFLKLAGFGSLVSRHFPNGTLSDTNENRKEQYFYGKVGRKNLFDSVYIVTL